MIRDHTREARSQNWCQTKDRVRAGAGIEVRVRFASTLRTPRRARHASTG